MACIFVHECNKCGFSLSFGPCPSEQPIKAGTGFDSNCLCMTCWKQGNEKKAESWGYDSEQLDKMKCPYCGSTNVMTLSGLFNELGPTCPKCKKGRLGEIIYHIQDREDKPVKLPHLH